MTLYKKDIRIETKKMLNLLMAITLGLSFLTGCDSGGSSGSNGEDAEITAKSLGLEGKWESDCREQPRHESEKLKLEFSGSEMDFGFTNYSNDSCTLERYTTHPKYTITFQKPITTSEGLTAYPLEAVGKTIDKTAKYLLVVQGEKLLWTYAAHDSNDYPTGLDGATREFFRVQ